MRQTDLVLLYRGGSSSSTNGVAYPVALRNKGVGTFWDVELRATHDGEETDRKVVRQIGPQSESENVSLSIPSRFCDNGTPGIGRRPLGRALAEALVDGEVVASVELPSARPEEPEIDRVPRTPEEEAALLRLRPDGWEYLLFAAVLRRRMNDLEPKYRDHELRFAPPAKGPVSGGQEATTVISNAFGQSTMLLDNFNRLFDGSAHERAFGAPGEPGDAERIEHLAGRMMDIYEAFLDWAAQLRATPVEEELRRAVDLSSRFVDQPIQQFRDFVDETVAEMDRLPSLLRGETGEPLRFTITVTLSIEEGLEVELHEELRRLEDLFGDEDGDWPYE